MIERKTDEQVLDEYIKEMGFDILENNKKLLLPFVKRLREDEPRINSGWHLVCYCEMCDDDDTMDSFYGADFFEKNP